jgi:hypothetical protein
MKKKKKKLANGGVLIEPATMIVFKEKQPGHYVGYTVPSKKLAELMQGNEEITVHGSVIGHDLVIKPKEP